MATLLAHTPLHDWHAAHGGRLVDFAGWAMPVQYTSIVAEHQATRTAAGLFDVSHMGRLYFRGSGAAAYLDRLVTRRTTDMQSGQVRYALLTNDSGGILDDVLVYAPAAFDVPSPAPTSHDASSHVAPAWMMVVNASNRVKILDWLAHFPPRDCELYDATGDTAMIAVQGPRAADLLAPLFGDRPSALKYYHVAHLPLPKSHATALVSRTGYTGEDGWELIVPAEQAPAVWTLLWETLQPLGAQAAGLGARDTLRLEAGMPLYGHELSEQIDPFQAGLAFAVDLDGRTFPGRDALSAKRQQADRPVRIGLELSGKRVPREGYPLVAQDETIGQVTSGTFSPTLDRPIAMGYVRPQFATPGTSISVDLRGRAEPARVVPLPFYRRSKPGRNT